MEAEFFNDVFFLETTWVLKVATLLFLISLFLIFKKFNQKTRFMPPRPKAWFLFGNVPEMDLKKPFLTLTKWAQEFGDVFMIRDFSRDILVLGSAETIHEANVIRDVDYAGRPKSFRVSYAYKCKDIVFQTYGPELIFLRKISHKGLKLFDTGMEKVENISLDVVSDLVKTLGSKVGQDIDPRLLIHSSMVNIMCVMIFGFKYEENDPQFAVVKKMESLYLEAMSPVDGAELDLFPWLRFFGNKTFKKLKLANKIRDKFFTEHIINMRNNLDAESQNSLLEVLLKSQKDDHMGQMCLTDEVIIFAMADILLTGTFTTSLALYGFYNILVHYPKIQKNIQDEISRVAGKEEITLKHYTSMNYVRATIYELLRYTSHIPVPIPRETMCDTKMKGYDIPKGTMVFMNLWKVHHDENFWENHWEFKPERFLDDNGILVLPDHPNRKHVLAFGAGRRGCLGENLATSRMFLFIAILLQKFEFLPPKSEAPTSCDPRSYEYSSVLCPKTYKVNITQRQEFDS